MLLLKKSCDEVYYRRLSGAPLAAERNHRSVLGVDPRYIRDHALAKRSPIEQIVLEVTYGAVGIHD